MGQTNDINLLRPTTKLLCEEFIRQCKEAGQPVRIVETKRTQETQSAYYAQGRESLERVNELRKIAGLYTLKEAENKYIVTKVKDVTTGAHYWGLAWDYVILNSKGKDWWDAPETLWHKTQEIALKLNIKGITLEAGGSWKFQDNPHMQIKGWQKYK